MTTRNLPAPDPIAKAHSDKVREAISTEIRQQGPIPFARYMQLALYAPGLGYYSAGAQKFGPAGDFVTAPEISPLFSQCVARQCHQVLNELHGGDILELGAGSGVMAVELLRELERQQQLPAHYFILEVSADLRQRQQQLLKNEIPQLFSIVKWLDRLPERFTGVMLGNEVLDAMPVHKFYIEDGVQEFYVDLKDNEFVWHLSTPSTLELIKQVESMAFETEYESEINLLAAPWLSSLADVLEEGLILLIDYGFPRHEYYHPQRNEGTLMCHYRHRAHDNPLIYPGIQDITAHVDFTLLAEVAMENELTISGFVHQAGFLLNCGIDSLIPKTEDVEVHYKFAQQIKRLTLPSEMGELFKAIAFTKNYSSPLIGFSAMSQLERL